MSIIILNLCIMGRNWRHPNSVKNRFKKGNIPIRKAKVVSQTQNGIDYSRSFWAPRMSQELHDLVVRQGPDGMHTVVNCYGELGLAKMLRPRHTMVAPPVVDGDPNSEQMLPLHKGKTEEMITSTVNDHLRRSPNCKVADFHFVENKKVSICWQVKVLMLHYQSSVAELLGRWANLGVITTTELLRVLVRIPLPA